jgi:DNA-binding transcriptional regulator YdaS (Cro superfamily)
VNRGIVRALEIEGSQRRLAASMGVNQSSVHKWLYRSLSIERAVEIHRRYGVPLELLRPDIFATATRREDEQGEEEGAAEPTGSS